MQWKAPGNGEAIVRIGPRTGGTRSVVFDDAASTYRFAIALAGSPIGQQIEQRVREQAGLPTPAAAPATMGGGAPAGVASVRRRPAADTVGCEFGAAWEEVRRSRGLES